MEEETKIVEAVYVKQVKLYKCLTTSMSNDNENDDRALLIMKLYDTTHYGEPGTNTERVMQATTTEFETTWLSLRALCMDDPSVFEPNLLDSLYATQVFVNDTSYVSISKEITCYLSSLFDFGCGTGERASLFRLIFVVDVERLLAYEDYLASKAKFLDNLEKIQLNNTNTNNNTNNTKNEVVSEGDSEMKNCYYANDDEFDDVEMEDDDDENDDFLEEVIKIAKSWLEIDEMSSLVEVKSSATIESMKVHCVTCKEMICVRDGDDNNSVDDCAICWTKFSGTKFYDNGYFADASEGHTHEIVKLGCGHEFHHRCVFKWLSRNPSCPLCRSSSLVYVEI